jgi:hypothetical protein
MSIESTRRGLYLAQRGLGTLQAAQRGPKPLCKRLVRRTVTRQLMKPYGKLWRVL